MPVHKEASRPATRLMEWIKNPGKYEVKWEKKINSKDDDYAPAYADKTHNSIMFTSDREAASGKNIDNWTGKRFLRPFHCP